MGESHLLRGISCVFTESYSLAIGQAALAAMPHGDMDPGNSLLEGMSTVLIDAAGLRHKLAYAEKAPAQWRAIADNDFAVDATPTQRPAASGWVDKAQMALAATFAAAAFAYDCRTDVPIAAGLLYVPLVILAAAQPGCIRLGWRRRSGSC